jgi:hypothetical protein
MTKTTKIHIFVKMQLFFSDPRESYQFFHILDLKGNGLSWAKSSIDVGFFQLGSALSKSAILSTKVVRSEKFSENLKPTLSEMLEKLSI